MGPRACRLDRIPVLQEFIMQGPGFYIQRRQYDVNGIISLWVWLVRHETTRNGTHIPQNKRLIDTNAVFLQTALCLALEQSGIMHMYILLWISFIRLRDTARSMFSRINISTEY